MVYKIIGHRFSLGLVYLHTSVPGTMIVMFTPTLANSLAQHLIHTHYTLLSQGSPHKSPYTTGPLAKLCLEFNGIYCYE